MAGTTEDMQILCPERNLDSAAGKDFSWHFGL
ncbi:hypothetical protein F0726_02842 [Acidithiobacillus caldus]|nr:hypothetical protein F0726_02842 [Acidithiobacillus caldus]